MAENATQGNETTEQAGNKFVEFVDSAQFGTPEYEAISDYFSLEKLRGELQTDHEIIISARDDPKGKLIGESSARITELKIALLEHQINQKDSHTRGYSPAYVNTVSLIESLLTAARKEAEAKFPTDPKMRSPYISAAYDDVMSTAENALFKKLEQPSSS